MPKDYRAEYVISDPHELGTVGIFRLTGCFPCDRERTDNKKLQ